MQPHQRSKIFRGLNIKSFIRWHYRRIPMQKYTSWRPRKSRVRKGKEGIYVYLILDFVPMQWTHGKKMGSVIRPLVRLWNVFFFFSICHHSQTTYGKKRDFTPSSTCSQLSLFWWPPFRLKVVLLLAPERSAKEVRKKGEIVGGGTQNHIFQKMPSF